MLFSLAFVPGVVTLHVVYESKLFVEGEINMCGPYTFQKFCNKLHAQVLEIFSKIQLGVFF